MISPKYALSHYYFKNLGASNVVNLYLDYNCPFSAKIFFKLIEAIPKVQKSKPNSCQFVFVNVVQPWHPQSVLLHEYSLVVAQLLREKVPEQSNELFWLVSKAIFQNKEKFYDTVVASLTRNEIYKSINETVFSEVSLPLDKQEILDGLIIKLTSLENADNNGNKATVDLKYFTRFLRVVGVHITPTVSVNGIVVDSISSSDSVENLVETFSSYA